MPSVHDIPGSHQALYRCRSHAAATATEKAFCFVAPFKCKIVAVDLIPDAAITGAATHTTHVNLLNAGTAGSGTTELAAKDWVNAVDATVGQTVSLYAPATPLAIAEGVKLALELQKVGNGLLLPGFLVRIFYQGN